MWICQRNAYFKFIPSTRTHILIPFEDSEPTGLKVDTAERAMHLLPVCSRSRQTDRPTFSPLLMEQLMPWNRQTHLFPSLDGAFDAMEQTDRQTHLFSSLDGAVDATEYEVQTFPIASLVMLELNHPILGP